MVDLKQNLKKKDDSEIPKETTKAGGTKDKGKRKRKFFEVEPKESEQGPITKVHVDDTTVNRQTIFDNLSTQSVFAGRVFDMNIVTQPGMDTLHDIVVIHSWINLFDTVSCSP